MFVRGHKVIPGWADHSHCLYRSSNKERKITWIGQLYYPGRVKSKVLCFRSERPRRAKKKAGNSNGAFYSLLCKAGSLFKSTFLEIVWYKSKNVRKRSTRELNFQSKINHIICAVLSHMRGMVRKLVAAYIKIRLFVRFILVREAAPL